MATFTIRNIDMTLDVSSISKAIDQIKEIKSRLKPAMMKLISDLAESGVEIARAELVAFDPPAFFTGELSKSIQFSMNGDGATVYAGAEYAIYVEEGTGVFNAGGRQDGWYYYNKRDGKVYHTYGMAPRPFMYNTYRKLEDVVEANGGRIIAEYIA